jgi:hypothetical protein
MRWTQEYVGYIAAILIFAAVVLWASDAQPGVVATIVAAAAVLFVIMLRSWKRAAKVLVVGKRRTEPVDMLEEALDDAGYGFTFCGGPDAGPCPVYAGRPCPVHGHPIAAVIVREPGSPAPVPPCGRALHIPALPLDAGDRLPSETVRDLEALRSAW